MSHAEQEQFKEIVQNSFDFDENESNDRTITDNQPNFGFNVLNTLTEEEEEVKSEDQPIIIRHSRND